MNAEMEIQWKQVQQLARNFLETADQLHEKVSAYIDGSDDLENVEAYYKVLELNVAMNRAEAAFFGEPVRPAQLDYDVAESIIGEW